MHSKVRSASLAIPTAGGRQRERARERVSGGFKKAGRTEAGGKRAAASKARTQATTSEAQAEAAASRKLASVRADVEETESVTRAASSTPGARPPNSRHGEVSERTRIGVKPISRRTRRHENPHSYLAWRRGVTETFVGLFERCSYNARSV